MADEQVDRFLASLEATFDASVARAEEEAATDLALSLLQDATLADVVRRAGPLEAVCLHGTVTVRSVGTNYLACDAGILLPLSRAIVRSVRGGTPPTITDDPLLSVLRRAARRGARVEITTTGGTVVGRLVRACVDHVVVHESIAGRRNRSDRGEALVGVAAIESIRIVDEAMP